MCADGSYVFIGRFTIAVPVRYLLFLMLGAFLSAQATNVTKDSLTASREAKSAGIYPQYSGALLNGHDFNTITQKPASPGGEAGQTQDFGAERKLEIKMKVEAFWNMTRAKPMATMAA
uniref:Uncharacterized protein n=1 Tax=Pseudodiaptomus poplesia TaxID=213370 RepID=A0A0U2LGC5_9MAXI|nr:hypothetical protein [Pseudodiaptomus poplesia]